MRQIFVGLPLVVGLAAVAASPGSAMLISAGSPSFTVDWSQVVDAASDKLTGTATFSNFVFNGNGLTFDIAIANTTTQQPFSMSA